MEQYRDLSIMEIDSKRVLVYACDMSASIGEKENDVLQCPVEIMSQMCVRVPLMELLCINALPQLVINLCGVERFPTAERMIQGIQSELEQAGFPNLPMNGSTEDNMATTMTSIGITLMGTADKDRLYYRSVKPGYLAVQVGIPYVGAALLEHFNDIVSYNMVKNILAIPEVVEIAPIGSKGALNEAEQIAMCNHLQFSIASEEVARNPLHQQSGGPATSIVVAIAPEGMSMLQGQHKDVFILGHFVRGNDI